MNNFNNNYTVEDIMNIVDESFKRKEKDNKKIVTKIILVSIILIVVAIISIIVYMMYLENSKLKLILNNGINNQLKDLALIESDGTVYFPIKEVSKYFGYESYNGEYNDKSEEASKCYVQSENEIANMELGSNRIYKLDLTGNDSNYEYVYAKKPVKAINGVLYGSSEMMEKAFNITFEYDKDKNRMYIFTIPYLVESYSNKILDYGYTDLDSTFVNQKAILDNILIVKLNEKYGVIDVEGNTILEAKYDDIEYLLNTGDFLITNNNKKGILSKTKETKIQIIYDNIELLDSDINLYVVKKDGKFGIVDFNGNVKVYVENEDIGIDISSFEENNIKNKFILVDNLIPIKKDGKWGLFNKKGNQVVDFKYDSLGYIASNNKNALNLLVIPNYNVLVACENGKYTLVNSSGEELFATVADDIYMTISGGEKYYYIAVNNQMMNAEEYLDKRGISTKTTNTTTSNTTTNNNNETKNTDTQEESENDDNQEQIDDNVEGQEDE
jgi:hypothetical protein